MDSPEAWAAAVLAKSSFPRGHKGDMVPPVLETASFPVWYMGACKRCCGQGLSALGVVLWGEDRGHLEEVVEWGLWETLSAPSLPSVSLLQRGDTAESLWMHLTLRILPPRPFL